jgi:F420-non-reducing hydrogenase iron-sulfur subunit
MTESEFNPFILGICCNWCTYAGADQAGTSRMQRPANLRIMRVMCGGRVEPHFVLDALRNGADGVLVSHCHPLTVIQVIAIMLRVILKQ